MVLSVPILDRLNSWAKASGNKAIVLVSSPAHHELLQDLSLGRLEFFYLSKIRSVFHWIKFLRKSWGSDILLAAPNIPLDTVGRVANLIRPRQVIAEGVGNIMFDDSIHILDVQKKLIIASGLEGASSVPHLSINQRLGRRAFKILGLHPFTNPEKISKQWPIENFIELVCSYSFDKIILFGGSSDNEKLGALKLQYPDLPLSLPQTFDMSETLRNLRLCDIFIGGDTGPVHMAAAMKIPVFSVFGPTNPKRVGPIYTEHRILVPGTECHPCYRGEWTKCHCISKISAQRACLEFNEFLDELKNNANSNYS